MLGAGSQADAATVGGMRDRLNLAYNRDATPDGVRLGFRERGRVSPKFQSDVISAAAPRTPNSPTTFATSLTCEVGPET